MISFDYKAFLDGNAFLEPHKISGVLKNNFTKELSSEERGKALIEIQCYEFHFKNGTLCPLLENILPSGETSCYPDIRQFTKEMVEYINGRMSESTHPFPKARYAHLLWMNKKHNRFAKVAINSYRELCSLYYDVSVKGSPHFHHFTFAVAAYHYISSSSKVNVEECKLYLQALLKDDKIPITWKGNILLIILESTSFKKDDFIGLTDLMLSMIPENAETYSNKDHFLQECLRVSAKEGVSSERIYALLGDNEMELAGLKEDDESGLILLSCYQKAAYYFKLAHNIARYDEAVGFYTMQKGKLQFKSFQFEFSHDQVEKINGELNAIVDKMLSNSETNPLNYLVYNRHFLMNEEQLLKEAEGATQNSIAYIANTSVFDINNNGRELDDNGKFAFQKHQVYSLNLQVTTIPLLSKFFYAGVRTGVINREKVIAFFNETWLAKGLEVFSVDQKKELFSWIELLGPGLYELVSQMEAKILDHKFVPNFILSIDSLSIKVEGLIRDLARLAGLNVTKIKEGESVEMNLEELLRDDLVAKLFKDYDVLLWKFVLTRNGWNVRNNSAHSFFRPSDYSENKAILVLLCIFRLCRYGDILDSIPN